MQPTFMNLKSKESHGFRNAWDPNALGLLAHTHTHTHTQIVASVNFLNKINNYMNT